MFRCLSQRQAKKEQDVLSRVRISSYTWKFPFLFTCGYTICKVKSPHLLIDTGPNSEQSTSLISKPKPQSLKLLYFATWLHSTVTTDTLQVYRAGYSVSCIWLTLRGKDFRWTEDTRTLNEQDNGKTKNLILWNRFWIFWKRFGFGSKQIEFYIQI